MGMKSGIQLRLLAMLLFDFFSLNFIRRQLSSLMLLQLDVYWCHTDTCIDYLLIRKFQKQQQQPRPQCTKHIYMWCLLF